MRFSRNFISRTSIATTRSFSSRFIGSTSGSEKKERGGGERALDPIDELEFQLSYNSGPAHIHRPQFHNFLLDLRELRSLEAWCSGKTIARQPFHVTNTNWHVLKERGITLPFLEQRERREVKQGWLKMEAAASMHKNTEHPR